MPVGLNDTWHAQYGTELVFDVLHLLAPSDEIFIYVQKYNIL